MDKLRVGLRGFCSVSVIFLLVYASLGCIGGKVVESNSVESAEDHSAENVENLSVEKPGKDFSPMLLGGVATFEGYNVLREYLSSAESIEFAGKIVGFEVVHPETDLKLQKVVVSPQWTSVDLIYSDKPLENIRQNDRRYIEFELDKVVVGSNAIVVSATLLDMNASIAEKFGKFRINGNPASGYGAGEMKMRYIDEKGREHYSEGPYQRGRVIWYVVINSNQSIHYSIAGDLSLEELKDIAGTMKKPERVLIKPKPLPTRPPPISRPKAGEETGS